MVEKQLCDQLFLTNLKTKQKHDDTKIYCGNWLSCGSGGVVDKKSDLGYIFPWSSIAVVFFLKKKRSSNFCHFTQALVVQMLDSAIGFPYTYPADSYSSGG